ncbi:MAG TPA: NAD(P)H-dependent oxidoreductase subunit E [Caldithrix sp.]|nr:NAD(P)H-dependent oxidoreductase subunit E [Caldithrix sp.]
MKQKDYLKIFSNFKGKEEELILILIRIQEKEGYISPEAIRQTSRFLKISENQIYGVASFYPKYRFTEPGKKFIRVCMGTACHVRGGQYLADAVGWQYGISIGQTTPDKRFDFQRATCLGCCTLGPVVEIDNEVHSRMMVTRLKEILEEHR